MTKEDLREIIKPMFAQLEMKIDNLQENHGKEITRLDKQSNEHYDAARVLEDKLIDRLELVKQQLDSSSHAQGERIGDVEGDMIKRCEIIKGIRKDLDGMTSRKRWGSEMWIIIAVAAGAPFVAKLIELF